MDAEPERIVHFNRNVKRPAKRGLADFSFDTNDALQVAAKLREAFRGAAPLPPLPPAADEVE